MRKATAIDNLRIEFGKFLEANEELIVDLWSAYSDAHEELSGEKPSINYTQFLKLALTKGDFALSDTRVKPLLKPVHGKERKATFKTHTEVELALEFGLMTKQEGAAYKANITMSRRAA